ncbi:hypothetical protein BPC006_I1515 [Burkholderia pseudomallei BPC006]|nr:hypothetical protein BPC006_I1515 [Burkholderia pseudomallei BPC006]
MPDRRGRRRGRVALDAAPHRIAPHRIASHRSRPCRRSHASRPRHGAARGSCSSRSRTTGEESTASHSVQAISTAALDTDSQYVIATGTFRLSPLATSGAGDTVSRIGARIHRLASNAA